MRVNHAGEVCAQALYQGQALTAKLPEVGQQMEEAAAEEIDHLAWCEERITELGGNTSLLNPIWYAMSFGIGAGAGLISDKLSLGFVAATEDQVCEHLKIHLDQLPVNDHKSRAIVEEMLVDEERHAMDVVVDEENLAIAIPKGRDVGMPYLQAFAQRAQKTGQVSQMAQRAGLRGLVRAN